MDREEETWEVHLENPAAMARLDHGVVRLAARHLHLNEILDAKAPLDHEVETLADRPETPVATDPLDQGKAIWLFRPGNRAGTDLLDREVAT